MYKSRLLGIFSTVNVGGIGLYTSNKKYIYMNWLFDGIGDQSYMQLDVVSRKMAISLCFKYCKWPQAYKILIYLKKKLKIFKIAFILKIYETSTEDVWYHLKIITSP